MESVVYTLFLVGIIQAAFCAMFLLTRRDHGLADWLFVCLMVIISWPLLAKTATDSGFYPPDLQSLKLLPAFYGPIGYLCLVVVLNDRLTWRNMTHLLPPLFILFWAVLFDLDLPPHEHGEEPPPGPPPPLHFVPMLGVPLLSVVYPVMGFILLMHPAAKAHGARIFLWIFNIASLLPLAIPLLRMFSIARDWGPLPVGFVFLAMEYTVSLCALKIRLAPARHHDIPANVANGLGTDSERGPGKYEKTGLSDREAKQLADRLVTFMNSEKPYLDDTLDVVALANLLNVSRHHLSQVLSQHLGKNFYSYVNELRIAEVQRQMADPAFRDYSIFRIAMSCGFSSKSTFNSVFKNITGMTPNEYRRPHQQGSKEVS